MDEGSLYELAESIKAQGVMQPILVRRSAAGRYEIIAGERRMRAARLAGLDEVPVLVKDVPDEAAAAMALIENIQREDLNPLEEAQGLKRLTDEFGLTHEQAAQAVGRSRSAASNLLRLLNLSEPVQQMLMAGDIDMGHARALLPLDGAQQILAAGDVVARKLSVREAEKLVAKLQHARQQPAAARRAREVARRGAPRGGALRRADRHGRDPHQEAHQARRAGRSGDRASARSTSSTACSTSSASARAEVVRRAAALRNFARCGVLTSGVSFNR